MNTKITLSALLLAAATTVGFMLPNTAAARDNHVAKREAPVKFVHSDRQRHHYRHQTPQHVPRWMRHYNRHHTYGQHYRPWRRHPGIYLDKHALKKHYRRMERHQHRHDHHPYRGYGDNNIHFRIDYWN